MDIFLKSKQRIRVPIPKGSFKTPYALDKLLSNRTHESGVSQYFESYREFYERMLAKKAAIAAAKSNQRSRLRRSVSVNNIDQDSATAESSEDGGDATVLEQRWNTAQDDSEIDSSGQHVRKKRRLEEQSPLINPAPAPLSTPKSNPPISQSGAAPTPKSNNALVASGENLIPNSPIANTTDSSTSDATQQQQHQQAHGQTLALVQNKDQGKNKKDPPVEPLLTVGDFLSGKRPAHKPKLLPPLAQYAHGKPWTAAAFGQALINQKLTFEPPEVVISERDVHLNEIYDELELNMSEESDQQWSFEKLKHYVNATNLDYMENLDKFQLNTTDSDILAVRLSPQLSYSLGYSTVDGDAHSLIFPKQFAKYTCDVKGGNSHICVYAHGLIENMIVGDTMTSLLRIVSVTGKHGDEIERVYDSPIFNKVQAREIHEIQIELRSLENRPIAFDYGVVIVTLCFKKAIYF